MLIGNLFQQAYNLADSVIIGRLLGSGALAAVGASSLISSLLIKSVRFVHTQQKDIIGFSPK